MFRSQLVVGVCCIAVFVFAVSGCAPTASGPKTVPVSGTVTMDGKPLANAMVRFIPEAGGRPSFGITDAQGRYELSYTESQKGAILGKHRVEITTYGVGAEEDEEYGGASPGATKETVPAKYNVNSELTAVVEDKNNEFNFELSSEGEIIQPGAEEAEEAEGAAPDDET
ncbi:MAG: carboxypeptidase regulatory-like domain-containing protein [Planctomycetes bacterium]|nr:carboxypeptidase regulatory-like domain-containing protein [Planctomycetota bacterium]